jgi:competence ComEA-like helix-hairpin-helix protein
MLTRDERRAVLFLALLAAAGGVLRALRRDEGTDGLPPVAAHLRGGDLVRQAELSRRAEEMARPLLPGEKVDVDRATAAELERLPRVGPVLARRIVEDREARGSFGSLEGLDRVSGVGPGLLVAIERFVTFSGRPAAASSPRPPASGAVGSPGAGSGSRASACPPRRGLSVNVATAEQLSCVTGVGAALAARLVADRAARGRFGQPRDLERVPGIGAVLARRIAASFAVP